MYGITPPSQTLGRCRCRNRIRSYGFRASLALKRIIWAAQHNCRYIALNTPVDRTKRIWEIYDDAAIDGRVIPGSDSHAS